MNVVRFPNPAVIAVCKKYGSQLKVPFTLEGWRVMLAIAAVESGGSVPAAAGLDCGPRHEPAFDTGGWFGDYSEPQKELIKKFGSPAAACSYGPWQMMLCNFSEGLTPDQLNTDLELCAVEFVREFNLEQSRFAWMLLAQIGQVWNTGRETRDPDYVRRLARAYDATANFD